MIEPAWEFPDSTAYVGDARDVLKQLPTASVHCVITSPPFFGLRDYGLPPSIWGGQGECQHTWHEAVYQRRSNDGGKEGRKQITNRGANRRDDPIYHATCETCGAWRGCLGQETTVQGYVAHLIMVLDEVMRVLHPHGSVWLNIADSCATHAASRTAYAHNFLSPEVSLREGIYKTKPRAQHSGIKEKDRFAVPERLILGLVERGWYYRDRITWCKTAPLPEPSVDRTVRATEEILVLSKARKYSYDWFGLRAHLGAKHRPWNYWVLGPESGPSGHYAKYPTAIPRRALIAGTSEGGVCSSCATPTTRRLVKIGRDKNGWIYASDGWDMSCGHAVDTRPAVVLDPFSGSGTTLLVARELGRHSIGIDLSPTYVEMTRVRLLKSQPRLPLDVVATPRTKKSKEAPAPATQLVMSL